MVALGQLLPTSKFYSKSCQERTPHIDANDLDGLALDKFPV
jgi:hypothetical protein